MWASEVTPGPFSVELSSLLVRKVNYEIPSLKKQIAKCQQLQQEYSRKEEEGQAGATEMREQFYHLCKQYGITVSGRGLPDVGGHRGLCPSSGPRAFASGRPSQPIGLPSPGVSPLLLSSLGRQCPQRAAGPGEGAAESAGRGWGAGAVPGGSH